MKKLYILAVMIIFIISTASAQETLYTTPLFSANLWGNDLTTANVAWKSTKGCNTKNGVTQCPQGGIMELTKRDGHYAHCQFADAASKFLIAKDFQIDLTNNLPLGLTRDDIEIKAIELRVEKYSQEPSTTNKPNAVRDNQVRLIKNGNINVQGYRVNESDKAKTQVWKDIPTVHIYGGDNDNYPLWGTTWTVDDLESPEFGVAFSAVAPDANLSHYAYVGMIRIRVTYAKKQIIAPLPVTLMHFTAKPEQKQVKLNWATATEVNNDYFAVERSVDGKAFTTIAEVKGAGNSQEVKEYQYIDKSKTEQTVYYRLKQTDYDGTTAYSAVVAVTTKGGFEPTVSVYPNPSDGKDLRLYANFLDQAPTQLTIYNQTGAIIKQSEIPVTAEQSVNLNSTGTLAPGVYVVVLSQNGKMTKEKIVVQ